MTWHSVLSSFHIAVAAMALLIGPVAMAVGKRRGMPTLVGEACFWITTVVCTTGGILVIFEWAKLKLFLLIALSTFTFALLGYLAAKVRWRQWLLAHVCG